MVLSAVSAAGTIDPMINYTSQFWQVFQILYDGLLKFKQADRDEGYEIVPDLAEGAARTARTAARPMSFKLRKGIKFSNGEEVTPADVVASFQRIFKVNSPTSGSFYNNIVGADKCIARCRHLHARRRHRSGRGCRHGDLPSGRAGLGILPQARRAARNRAARRHPCGRCGHPSHSRHRRLCRFELRPERQDGPDAQSRIHRMERGCAA